MENSYETQNDFDETINMPEIAQRDLRVAGGWALFFAILGFIFSFLIIISFIIMIFSGTLSAFDQLNSPLPISGSFMLGMYLSMIVIYLTISILLLKFSSNARKVSQSGSELNIAHAMSSLKKLFMINGIITIVLILAYIVFFIILLATAATL